MIREIRGLIKKKYFYKSIIIFIIVVILFILGVIVLKYQVEGETNMPFILSKISIISSQEGTDAEAQTNTKWNFNIDQNNDIYLYIERNNNYGKTEAIQSILVDNIQIESKQKDKIKLYKPEPQEEKTIFQNKQENEIQNIQYLGDVESNLKQLKISNQGGILAFRCAYQNIANYAADDEQINHQELLKKAGVTEEDLNAKMTFNLKIILEGGREYQTNISLDFPIQGIIDSGVTSKEITQTKDFIFKRLNQ